MSVAVVEPLPELVVAADGSAGDGLTGWGWYAADGRFGWGGGLERQDAEILAICAAVRAFGGEPLIVLTDYRSAHDRLVEGLYLDRPLARTPEWKLARFLLRGQTRLAYLTPAARIRGARSYHPTAPNDYDACAAAMHACAHLLANAGRLRLPLTHRQLAAVLQDVLAAEHPVRHAEAVASAWSKGHRRGVQPPPARLLTVLGRGE